MRKVFLKVTIVSMALFMAGCDVSVKDKQKNNENEVKSVEETDTDDTNESGYTDEQLIKMAREYYEKVSDQKAPVVDIDSQDGDDVCIHIYEDNEDNIATLDWYTINRKTGKGENCLGDIIDITK